MEASCKYVESSPEPIGDAHHSNFILRAQGFQAAPLKASASPREYLYKIITDFFTVSGVGFNCNMKGRLWSLKLSQHTYTLGSPLGSRAPGVHGYAPLPSLETGPSDGPSPWRRGWPQPLTSLPLRGLGTHTHLQIRSTEQICPISNRWKLNLNPK